jgi:hypothetical protein
VPPSAGGSTIIPTTVLENEPKKDSDVLTDLGLPEQLRASMFTASNGETAWPIDRVVDAVTWIAARGLSILGGEAWLVDPERGITGLIPLVGSNSPAVRGWAADDRRPHEGWADYVDRSLDHAITVLRAEESAAPTEISPELIPYLRYNVTFQREQE